MYISHAESQGEFSVVTRTAAKMTGKETDMPGQKQYAGFPSAVVYAEPGGGDPGKKKKPVQHLLWGDEMEVKGPPTGDWQHICSRRVEGWVEKKYTQTDPLLDIVFVDIGQGDGCIVSTPQGKYILVDAGMEDNMLRFLKWRFDEFVQPQTFEAAVISHGDADHYRGFSPIFDEPQVSFGTVYHNGIVDRKADRDPDALGGVSGKGANAYLVNVIRDKSMLQQLLSQSALIDGKEYPQMLKKALDSGRVADMRMLSARDGYMPGYGPNDPMTIEVLSPVPKPDPQGNPRLPWFDNDIGRTKNGNSIMLRVTYNGLTLLLGGDLNITAENYLLSHYTCLDCPPPDAGHEDMVIESARKRLECEVTKSCHHGSADFTETFMRAVNPLVTVISSGDDESYSHPRADTLGAIGRNSRGRRPLIFSTELARSSKDTIQHPVMVKKELAKLNKAVEQATTDKAKTAAAAKLDKYYDEIVLRSVAVYGAINLRTDGKRLVMAQKIERPRDKAHKWDLYVFERGASGVLEYKGETP